jgi:hypothetical protein
MLLPPPGILRPNRAAIEAGLSFAQAFQNGPAAPWLARGGLAATTMALGGGGTIAALHGGHGVTGNGGYWGDTSASNTYALSTTEGTVLVALVSDHAANDGIAHQPFTIGSNSTNRAVEAVKWTDNNLYIGIIDKRMSFSVVGMYAAGDMFTMATTWNSAGQVAYVGGVQRATSASTGLGDTAGHFFRLGQDFGAARKWSSGTTGGVLYALAFDRALTAQEILVAERDLWWWCRQPAARTVRRSAGLAPLTSTITAGTLSLTASIAAEWSATPEPDTGARGGDDAWREDVVRLSRRERRLQRQTGERAARLRETLERAYRAATGGDEPAVAAALVQAAEVATPAQRAEIAAIPERGEMVDTLAAIGVMLNRIQRRRAVVSRDDDELALILSVM